MTARVSVVIPAFNAAAFLKAAIESVLHQSTAADEIIIVDDGSCDDTLNIARSFGEKTKVYARPHLGGSQTLNFGIENSAGDTLAFLDADDLWVKRKLTLQLSELVKEPTLEAVFGHVVQFNDADTSSPPPSDEELAKRKQPGLCKSAMLIRKPALLRIGLFDPGFQTADFPEWYVRALSLKLRSSVLPDVVAFRRIHDRNTTRVKQADLYSDYLKLARESISRRKNDL
jgi:glycosyltransferase involved in cell wall biosynthesis